MHLSSIIFALVFFTEYIQMSVSETIPCPGHEDPQNFTNIPLTERPKLAKILQHGWDPSLITLAVSPMKTSDINTHTEPLPMVNFQDGFVGRPFRTISKEACQGHLSVSHLRCVRSSSSSFTSGGISVEEQFRFQMVGVGDDWSTADPQIPTLFHNNYASFVEWSDTVQDFLDCNRGGSLIKYREKFTCVVHPMDCRTFDPEFLQDLKNLPITATSSSTTKARTTSTLDDVEREMYQAFVKKWGYGSVDRFLLGAREVILSLIPDDPQQQDIPFLHVGRTGGSEKDFLSEYIYTQEECLDPSPARIFLEPWDKVLEDMFLYDKYFPNENSTDYAVTKEVVDKMDALVSNFYELRQGYPFLFQHFEDFENFYVPPEKCQATTTPSPSPLVTTVPTSFATAKVTSKSDSTTPSANPTVTETNESNSTTTVTSASALLADGPKFWIVCLGFVLLTFS